ncbi:MAG: GPW/gp25 family protein [Chitinophagaceae bacterium]|nr:GPW/gp25 family protein [Chitinophagaceae bacterium]
MANIYYKIPFQLSAALSGNELATCDLRESITRNLELIIVTKFGEHRHDPGFGCEIWDLDFELIVSENKWEEKLRQSLLKSITTHEHRLNGVQLSVTISEIERQHLYKLYTEIKKKVDIQLSGVIHKTGEIFSFHNSLYLSPLAVD